ncbi:uncharacterized protein LACBIDRAFT_328675 [Laccaria bicolor S238N-H82]|uniref:Predicted protein n=1 Tax=Laccaria bicolor (strain S238N-H82 / ATCC MYA-4686) TaxID=486041 RepID=B0DFM8_LACBS|nr:uncharacterized protein LACBIDRAFT_328675 [Laccaria bicolor S238N-H82]EDR06371.1 predicted protein [Laccaria bicolor S238N-H82]|eukprot:XP_001882743.1 predicted protein [Laccaria bicolor S238N-H82]
MRSHLPRSGHDGGWDETSLLFLAFLHCTQQWSTASKNTTLGGLIFDQTSINTPIFLKIPPTCHQHDVRITKWRQSVALEKAPDSEQIHVLFLADYANILRVLPLNVNASMTTSAQLKRPTNYSHNLAKCPKTERKARDLESRVSTILDDRLKYTYTLQKLLNSASLCVNNHLRKEAGINDANPPPTQVYGVLHTPLEVIMIRTCAKCGCLHKARQRPEVFGRCLGFCIWLSLSTPIQHMRSGM